MKHYNTAFWQYPEESLLKKTENLNLAYYDN